MKILIVDDHAVVREGLTALFEADDAYEVVGSAATGEAARQMAIRLAPEVVLLDFRLQDTTGSDLCRRLRATLPDAVIVVLTSYDSEAAIRAAMTAGADGFVTKEDGVRVLKEVIEDLIAGGEASVNVRDYHDADASGLSRQDRELLELAARGLSDAEIARSLQLAESTVRFHMQKLKGRLDAPSKPGLVAQALRRGVISLDDEGVVGT